MSGPEFLIITLSVHASPESHKKIIGAAVEAGVRYIMPNEYGGDYSNASRDDPWYAGPWYRAVY